MFNCVIYFYIRIGIYYDQFYGSFKFPFFLVTQVTLLCVLSLDITHISKLDDLVNTISIKREGILSFHHCFGKHLHHVSSHSFDIRSEFLISDYVVQLLQILATNQISIQNVHLLLFVDFFIPPSFELLKLYIYVLGPSFRHIIFLACLCVAGCCNNTREHFHIYSGHGWSFIALLEVVHWKKFEWS
jgi:hypothetical protein